MKHWFHVQGVTSLDELRKFAQKEATPKPDHIAHPVTIHLHTHSVPCEHNEHEVHEIVMPKKETNGDN